MGERDILSFLRKRKVSKENLFAEKLRFSFNGDTVKFRLGHEGLAFVEPPLPKGDVGLRDERNSAFQSIPPNGKERVNAPSIFPTV